MASPTELRDRVSELAHRDAAAAAGLARSIDDPFFRCQALGWVARYAEGEEVLAFAREAMDAAGDCEDAYRQVVAGCWPIRALFENGRRDDALMFVELALGAVPRITPAASRAEALVNLLQAAFAAGEGVRRAIGFALAELADADPHWRVQRAFRDALALLASVDRPYAESLAGSQRLEEHREPRPFFW